MSIQTCPVVGLDKYPTAVFLQAADDSDSIGVDVDVSNPSALIEYVFTNAGQDASIGIFVLLCHRVQGTRDTDEGFYILDPHRYLSLKVPVDCS